MKIFKNKLFWEIVLYTITVLISLAIYILIIWALLKFILG